MAFDGMFPKVTDEFGHWFAGFTDGEGYFGINVPLPTYPTIYHCQFQIGQRSDDVAVLENIHETMGIGHVSCRAHSYTRELRDGKTYKQHPQCTYYVARKKELPHVVSFFERYPLRSKKQRDFEVWKLAVKEYSKSYYHPGKLRHYMNVLKTNRKYNADKQIIEELPDLQLALGIL